jgi:lysozyme family protein
VTFERAFALTIGEEGGESNNPADRGGHTYRGVTQRTFTAWLTANGQEDRDVITMTDAECRSIAKVMFWNRARCDDCPELTGSLHFDAAFNHGPANAIRLLQTALGVEVDGVFGPHTLGVLSAADDRAVLAAYFAARKDFYAHIVATTPSQAVFWQAWQNRLDHLRKALA